MTVDDRYGDRQFDNPTLCPALIEVGGGGFDAVDDKRQWAQEQVQAELARNWQARGPGSLSGLEGER